MQKTKKTLAVSNIFRIFVVGGREKATPPPTSRKFNVIKPIRDMRTNFGERQTIEVGSNIVNGVVTVSGHIKGVPGRFFRVTAHPDYFLHIDGVYTIKNVCAQKKYKELSDALVDIVEHIEKTCKERSPRETIHFLDLDTGEKFDCLLEELFDFISGFVEKYHL